MASLFKPVIIRYILDGKRVNKDTPGARPKKCKSSKWYGQYADANGQTQRVPLSMNKTVAQQMLAALVNKNENAKIGVVDPCEEHSRRPLTEQLDDFRRYLEDKDNTAEHVALSVNRIQAVLDGCGFVFIRDLAPGPVLHYLAERRKLPRKKGGISVASSNHYVRAIKAFSAWLAGNEQRAARDVLKHLSTLNAETDRRHERRSVPADEFRLLLECTRASAQQVCKLDGPARFLLYSVAGYTGLRIAELHSLTPASFDLTADPPTVTVQAGYSKRRRRDTLPLHPDLARMVGEYVEGMAADAPIWPGWNWHKKGASMLRHDLAAARAAWIAEAKGDEAEGKRRRESSFLTYQDAAGRVFDFHATRGQFISELARQGVHPKTAQLLARHSDINLTMNAYTHLGMVDLSAAVDSLPSPSSLGPKTERQTLRATGTDGDAARGCTVGCTKVAQTLDSDRDGLRRDEARTRSGGNEKTPGNTGVLRLSEAPRDGLKQRPFPDLNRGMTDLQSVAFPLG
jgi:integrase